VVSLYTIGKKVGQTDPVSVLGNAKGIHITKERTTLFNPPSDQVEERIKFLSDFVTDNDLLGEMDVDNITERISKLRGGLAIVHPGGTTDVQLQESKDRLEDAVCAVKASIEEGFVPGGGLALVQASKDLKQHFSENQDQDFKHGVEVVRMACQAPFRHIIDNAFADQTGGKASIILEKALS
jgi:chaperonin GroEL